MTTVSQPLIFDSRDVHLRLADAPNIYTPAGRLPIQPTSLRLHYSIPSGQLSSAEVYGKPTDERDIKRRTQWTYRRGERRGYVSGLKRRLKVDQLPPWLEAIVDEYRPRYSS